MHVYYRKQQQFVKVEQVVDLGKDTVGEINHGMSAVCSAYRVTLTLPDLWVNLPQRITQNKIYIYS